MADRSVTVRLRAEIADYQRKLAAAAATTKGFVKELDSADSRMSNIVQTALALGPALVPIGAIGVPAVAGLTAGLGAAAAAAAVTLLAFNGVGDALKAVNEYQLEPTTANLQKAQAALALLSPEGRHFVSFLQDLRPELQRVKGIAEGGLFPGVTEGLEELVELGPQVDSMVSRISSTLGDLAADAGASLNNDQWREFFDYLDDEAPKILSDMARTLGNVTEGIANMLMGFDPLTDQFSSGLLESSRDFKEWSRDLEDNEGFQSFVDTVERVTPKAVDTLGTLVDLLADVVAAAEPVGEATLPIIRGLAEVLGAVASSPAGPVLIATVSGLSAMSRAVALFNAANGSAITSFLTRTKEDGGKAGLGLSRAQLGMRGAATAAGILALAYTDLDDKAGLSNTAMGASIGLLGGPWGAAIGASVGLAKDLADAYGQVEDSIDDANDAMRDNSLDEQLQKRSELLKQLADEHPEEGTFAGWFDPDTVRGFFHDFTGQTGKMRGKVAELSDSLQQGGDIADLFGQSIGQTGDQLRSAAGGAEALSTNLAELNGWFDKREAIRNYRSEVANLAKALKDGFQPKDREQVDALGRSILQVASQMGQKRGAEFLQNARDSLADMADHAGPKAAAALQEVIDKFDEKGLTHPDPVEITADDRRLQDTLKQDQGDLDIMGKSSVEPTIGGNDNPWRGIYKHVRGDLSGLDVFTAQPTVDANTNPWNSAYTNVHGDLGVLDAFRATPAVGLQAGGAESLLGRLTTMLNNIDGRVATARVVTVFSQQGRPAGNVPPAAGGTTVPKTGLGYADRHLYLLADGEEVVSNRYGQADRHRPLLKAISANRLANGGTAGPAPIRPVDTYIRRQPAGSVAGAERWHEVATEMATETWHVVEGLKELKHRLEESQKTLAREKQQRDDAIAARDSFASQVGGAYSKADPFAGGLTEFDASTAANTNDTLAAQAALAAAAGNGLDGPLYQALAGSGNLLLVQQFAALSAAEIDRREQAFATQSKAQTGLGDYAAAAAGLDKTVGDLSKQVREQAKSNRELQQTIHQLEAAVERGAEKGTAKGAKDGAQGKDKNVAAQTWTQGRPLGGRNR